MGRLARLAVAEHRDGVQAESRIVSWAWMLGLLVAAALVGFGALGYLDSVNHRSPASVLPPERRPVTPIAAAPLDRPRRVTVVVLDGLRLDTSRAMPALEALRARGFDAVAETPLPSLSRPSYTTLASGVPPERSGVRNNAFAGPAPVDSIFDRARGAGLTTAGVANLSWWNELFGRSFSEWHPISGGAADSARAIAEAGTRADLSLVHLVDLDRVAHRLGAGEVYRAKAREVDGVVAGIVARLDLSRDALIVTSDHGHRDRGGHGGPEPEVTEVPLILAGKGISRSARPRSVGSSARLAPTLALLLGVELPQDGAVEPIVEALDERVLGSLSPRLAEVAQHRAAYDARLRSAARGRDFDLPWAPALVLFAGLLGFRRARSARRGLWATPVIGAAVLAALELADLPLTFSGIVTVPTLAATLAAGTAAGFAAYLLALSVLVRRIPPDERTAAWGWNLRATAIVHLALAPIVWSVFGYAHAGALPHPVAMFLPLPAAFVGAAVAVLCAAALFVSRQRVFVNRWQLEQRGASGK